MCLCVFVIPQRQQNQCINLPTNQLVHTISQEVSVIRLHFVVRN